MPPFNEDQPTYLLSPSPSHHTDTDNQPRTHIDRPSSFLLPPPATGPHPLPADTSIAPHPPDPFPKYHPPRKPHTGTRVRDQFKQLSIPNSPRWSPQTRASLPSTQRPTPPKTAPAPPPTSFQQSPKTSPHRETRPLPLAPASGGPPRHNQSNDGITGYGDGDTGTDTSTLPLPAASTSFLPTFMPSHSDNLGIDDTRVYGALPAEPNHPDKIHRGGLRAESSEASKIHENQQTDSSKPSNADDEGLQKYSSTSIKVSDDPIAASDKTTRVHGNQQSIPSEPSSPRAGSIVQRSRRGGVGRDDGGGRTGGEGAPDTEARQVGR